MFIFSPSIDIDPIWEPVKKYLKDALNQDESDKRDKQRYYFNSYEPEELEKIIVTQQKMVNYMQRHNYKHMYQICIVIDDFADTPAFTRRSLLLQQLYIRGRHYYCSTITSSQVFTSAIGPIIRKNITDFYIFRLRNYRDHEAWLEELSAVYDKKTLDALYHVAISEPHGFLYINMMAKDINDMFWASLKKRLIPKNNAIKEK